MDQLALCPRFESAFQLLGKRWNGLIIRAMLLGTTRFSDISEMIPQLSDRMLVERLKELQVEGIVERNVYPEIPVRVEYELTKKGRELERVMNQVQTWADVWCDKSKT